MVSFSVREKVPAELQPLSTKIINIADLMLVGLLTISYKSKRIMKSSLCCVAV